ncbi:alpha/beta-hydrolase [Mycena sanguinolenta]|nr:alpha/beta-hydrolase [Mycena sanguinolenta]
MGKPEHRVAASLRTKSVNHVLPAPSLAPASKKTSRTSISLILVAIFLAFSGFYYIQRSGAPHSSPTWNFYSNITRPRGICPSLTGDAPSYAGYIGIEGDTPNSPRRSFFWFFEAEEDASAAPIILTVGGGPGTTGMLRALGSQGPCILTANGTVPNKDRITQHFNLLSLDHPIGTGFSYGALANNSRDAALDVYDFLQKFFVLFPHLAKNQLVISGGSYGGKFIPHIATIIQEQNAALGVGLVHINLESLIVSNPSSDPMAHYRWLLYFYCELHNVYDADTCASMYAKLPNCLDLIEMSLQDLGFSNSANAARRAAREACNYIAWGGDTHGVMVDDVRKTCFNQSMDCFPLFAWIERYMHDPEVSHALCIPSFINYTALSDAVEEAFSATGDHMLPTHLLYEPLLASGIRVLHTIGAQDGNCAWPGVLSFLKLLKTPFRQEFVQARDVPWPTPDSDAATVRAIGEGAGNMTYILITDAGHFPQQDQPALVKEITERWISNRPWFGY